jgi:hypothetical protein
MKRLISAIARFLRIGDSFDIRRFVEANEKNTAKTKYSCYVIWVFNSNLQ